MFPASCGTLPSLSRLRSPTSHLFNLLVLVGGYLDRAYLLPVPESHCPPKDYSSEDGFEDAMTAMVLIAAMRLYMRMSNYLERLNREIERRACSVGTWPHSLS